MKGVSSIVLALLALCAWLAPAASAAPGELDPSFGVGGSERLFPSQEEVALRSVAAQPDGKIVVAGEAGIGAAPGDFLAVRYDSNGSADPSFGGGDGIEIVPVGSDEDRATAVTIGAGGRILLTGEARLPKNPKEPSKEGVEAGVVVLQPNGKPDPLFSGGSVRLHTTGAENADNGVGIAEGPERKVVVADATGNGAGNGFTIVRLLASGIPDPSFANNGVVNTPIPSATNPGARGRSTDVLVQADGRIVASGYGFDEVGPKKETDSKFAAVRYLDDGKLDPSFGGAGTGIFSKQVVETSSDSASWIALTPTGKLALAGGYSAPTLAGDSFAVVRLSPDGVLDPTFGAGGLAKRGPTALFGDLFEGAALDSRERVIVVSTVFEGGGKTSIEVSRFLGDVPPDQPPTPPGQPAPAPAPKPTPHARMKAIPRKLAAKKLKLFSGTASGSGGIIAKVQIAVVKRIPGGARASRAGKTCQVLQNAKARFKVVKPKKGKPCPQRWLNATGTAKWRFKLKATLPPGKYVVYARAVDASGLAESSFSRAAGNRYAFRLLAR